MCNVHETHTGCFFSKGPTQKISKYGIGPTQQDKMGKYTGPTQSYQREFSDYSDAVQWYSNIITHHNLFIIYSATKHPNHFDKMIY